MCPSFSSKPSKTKHTFNQSNKWDGWYAVVRCFSSLNPLVQTGLREKKKKQTKKEKEKKEREEERKDLLGRLQQTNHFFFPLDWC